MPMSDVLIELLQDRPDCDPVMHNRVMSFIRLVQSLEDFTRQYVANDDDVFDAEPLGEQLLNLCLDFLAPLGTAPKIEQYTKMPWSTVLSIMLRRNSVSEPALVQRLTQIMKAQRDLESLNIQCYTHGCEESQAADDADNELLSAIADYWGIL
jgi:hypothetical protein